MRTSTPVKARQPCEYVWLDIPKTGNGCILLNCFHCLLFYRSVLLSHAATTQTSLIRSSRFLPNPKTSTYTLQMTVLTKSKWSMEENWKERSWKNVSISTGQSIDSGIIRRIGVAWTNSFACSKRVLTHEQTMYMAKVGESIGLKITQSKWMVRKSHLASAA